MKLNGQATRDYYERALKRKTEYKESVANKKKRSAKEDRKKSEKKKSS